MWDRTKIFVVCLLIAVTALFLFPLTFGSFQSTNGPTTTQLEEVVFHIVLAVALLIIVPDFVPLIALEWRIEFSAATVPTPALEQLSTLRC